MYFVVGFCWIKFSVWREVSGPYPVVLHYYIEP